MLYVDWLQPKADEGAFYLASTGTWITYWWWSTFEDVVNQIQNIGEDHETTIIGVAAGCHGITLWWISTPKHIIYQVEDVREVASAIIVDIAADITRYCEPGFESPEIIGIYVIPR